MKIVAIDASLTSTGFAVWKDTAATVLLTRYRPPEKGLARLAAAYTWAAALAEGCDLMVIEGYSFGSKNSRAHSTGEFGGVVRLAFYKAGVPVVEVPPSCLKKFAHGKGDASKEAVLVAAVRRLGYEGASNDEADARWLLTMALHFEGIEVAPVPKSHLALTSKKKRWEWPRTLNTRSAA